MTSPHSRRAVLTSTGVALLGAAGGFAGYAAARPNIPAASTPAPYAGSGPQPAADDLVALEEVPEHGGVVLADRKIVVCRAAGSAVTAFSAVCTHAGCLVAGVSGGTINCPCHGSAFDVTTGHPVAGPARSPLATVAVSVVEGSVRKASTP